MRLSSLELQGFKSFPDKTYLEFDDGITAVVGPNGSGKSNIADAVRWVFGEQSTKTLRGGKMEDVIFSGTQTRKAVGYASVKLTIENLTDELTGEEGKTTISRRLYRSGESEYRINGNIVRLKDVYELFMDTGLGRDGYSIIGQGRIAEIVSAKSGQRREIFEEAAGIAKFRYRRNEAERQLLGAEDNLLRLNDILAELEDRVGPLKVQSEKAKKYIVLAEKRKELEISLWINGLNSLKKDISGQQDNTAIVKNDYNLLEVKSDTLEKEINLVYEQMQEMVVTADQRRTQIKALEEELSENEAKAAVLGNDIFHNNQTIKRVEEQLAGFGKDEHELALLIESKAKYEQELKEKIASINRNNENLKTQLIVLLEENNKAGKQIDELNIRKQSLVGAVSEIQLKQAANQSVISESIVRLDDLQQKDNEYDKVVNEYISNISECDVQVKEQKGVIQSLENSKNGYGLKKDSKQKVYEEIVARQNAITKEIERLLSRAKILEDMEASMEGYAGSVKYILNQSKKNALSGVFGPVSSLITTEPKFITAVETALGGSGQNIVVENEAVAKRGIAMLRDSKVGRATFLPLTSIKGSEMNFSQLKSNQGFIGAASSLVEYNSKFSGIINQILGRICVVDDLDTGSQIAKESGYKFRIVTLDGQVINSGGSYTGGAVYKSSGVLGRRNEIEKLKAKAKSLNIDTEKLTPELGEARAELASIDATLVGTDAEIKNANEELVRLGFAHEQLENGLKTAEENRLLAKSELEKLSNRLGELEKGEIDAKSIIDKSALEIAEFDESIGKLVEKKQSTELEIAEIREKLSEHQLTQLGLEKDRAAAVEELERTRQQAENREEQAKGFNQEIDQLKEKNKQTEEHIATAGTRKDTLVLNIESYNIEIAEVMNGRTEKEKAATLLRSEEREISGKKEEFSREIVRLEERQNGMQSQYDQTIAKLWDEYELTRSMAEEMAKPVENATAANDTLAQYRNQIKALGSVNLDAVEEYREVGERYEFLSAQLKDVESSRGQLRNLIGDLTGEMRTLFEENFVKIADEFSTTFTQLFGGGRGELRLTDEEDVLEAGIEIIVQPPGKVIKNLSLLSGGEQAFVAIAIYFAILKVKPAPFVLLDEIEAALDDVNVVKYASYLRTLAKEIQFIAITHRRGTMEEADVLYGVTMQENGVSKLLELKISEVERKLGMEAES